MLSVLYGPYDADTGGHVVTLTEATFYGGLNRAAWAVSLSYIIIACFLGQGGKINNCNIDTKISSKQVKQPRVKLITKYDKE